MTGWGLLAEELAALDQGGLRRQLRNIEGPAEAELQLDGRKLVNFGSNNYLGLAFHPEVIAAAREATAQYGAGAGASRLICGNHALYQRLEQALASLKGTEYALVFSTGYMANLGTIQAIVGEGDAVASDRLNHASLIDACRLSRARLLIYPHGDTDRLADMLDKYRPKYRRMLIVTDGLFSMDGDVAPLRSLMQLAERHDAWLLVDDAHGTGVLGAEGRGSFEYFCLTPTDNVIQMGTLSKALGSVGGFIAGPAVLRDFLVNRSRMLIYSTGLPAGPQAAALAALGVARRDPWRRQRLKEIAGQVRRSLRELGLTVLDGDGPIIPVILGDNLRAMRWMEALMERGCFVPGVRPPTVPEGEARLRISVMATHTDVHIDQLVGACASIAREEPR